MNNMSTRMVLFFTILQHLCAAQIADSAEKIIINNKAGYYCKVRSTDQSILLFRFGIESSERDSIYIFDKPSGLFKSHPNVFDVIDSTFFQVRIYTSGDGMQYSELRVYKENKIREYANKDTGYNYVASQNTLFDNSLPLNSYIRRIIRSEDTLKGPLYFDLAATPDSLLLFIYIDYLHKIEIWNFERYPLIKRKFSFEEGEKIMKKKPWTLSRVISADISSPFQLVQLGSKDKIYALCNNGELFDLSKKYAQKIEPKLPLKSIDGIIIDKQSKTTRYFSGKKLTIGKDNFLKIYKSSFIIKQ